ncbi:MAG: hypothetical protein AB9M53_00890 [Leptothrix sp. (in: b-proteobacteria)]
MKHRILPDVTRVAIMVVVASLLLFISTPIAVALGEPAIAPWGMFSGLAVYGAALSHVLRRALFPYLDLRDVAYRAMAGNPGAGLVFVGVCLVLAAMLMLMGGVAKAGDLPVNAPRVLPVLVAEQQATWPGMPAPSILAGQIEQESCISLTHKRCWSPTSELRTSRERGVGLGQITRTERFDSLAELRAQFPEQLRGWSWDSPTLYDPAFQIRALVLMDYRNWRVITGAADDRERLSMALTAYNGGLGGLNSDRRVCAATAGCDKSRWWGHVERTSLKARTAAHGYGESFFCTNHRYAARIAGRAVKYAPYTGGPIVAVSTNGTGCRV